MIVGVVALLITFINSRNQTKENDNLKNTNEQYHRELLEKNNKIILSQNEYIKQIEDLKEKSNTIEKLQNELNNKNVELLSLTKKATSHLPKEIIIGFTL